MKAAAARVRLLLVEVEVEVEDRPEGVVDGGGMALDELGPWSESLVEDRVCIVLGEWWRGCMKWIKP